MRTSYVSFLAVVGISAVALLSGCGGSEQPAETPPAKPAASPPGDAGHGHDHDHGAGPHEGTLVDWGGGKYHVEFTVDHDKKEAVVYILGGDEKTPVPIKSATLLLSIKDPNFQVELKARPLDGEPDGMSSRFLATHDSLGMVQEFQGTISGEVDGTPYVGEFEEEAHSHEEQ